MIQQSEAPVPSFDRTTKRKVTTPKWYLAYFLLAAFDLMTISGSLYLNHTIMAMFSDSVTINEEWADRLGQLATLRALAGITNAPGNDVFDSHDVPRESKRLEKALNVFMEHQELMKHELIRNLPSEESERLINEFDYVQVKIDTMVQEAHSIFYFFRMHQPKKAGERMATMDQKYALVLSALRKVGATLRELQGSRLKDQQLLAKSFQRSEYVIALFIILMVGAASLYGHRIYREMKIAAQDKEQFLETLEEKEGQIRAIVETVADGIYGLNLDGIITFTNPAGARMLGYEIKELIGMSVHTTILHAKPNSGLYPLEEYPMYAMLRDGNVHHEDNELFWRKDGSNFPVEYTSAPIREKGTLKGVVVTFKDISTRRKLEGQIALAQKMESIGQLAAGIAHEINTPTQFVSDNLRFLQESFGSIQDVLKSYGQLVHTLSSENSIDFHLLHTVKTTVAEADLEYTMKEIPKALEQSLDGAKRVATIVRAMKDLSHPGAIEKKQIDLNHTIESTATVARNEWKYVAELELNFDPHLPFVPCLPGELNQVILNLLVNAAHAIEEKGSKEKETKGTITINTSMNEDWAEIRVMDSGMGIPEDARSKIFDPFFTTKEVGKGTGQGLAIAHDVIVNKHGGTLTFKTELGTGTTFLIRLPLQKTPAGKEA